MEHHILLSFLSNYQPKKEIISSTSYETENGKISGYNSSEPAVKYVIKCLEANYFPDMTNAGKVIEEWKDDYNRNRPQKGLK